MIKIEMENDNDLEEAHKYCTIILKNEPNHQQAKLVSVFRFRFLIHLAQSNGFFRFEFESPFFLFVYLFCLLHISGIITDDG